MLNLLSRIFHFTWRTAWYLIASAIILLAVVFSTARALLPQAEQYRADIVTELSAYVGQPIDIGSLDAEWHGMEPSLVLKQVRLLAKEDKQPVLELKKVSLGFNLYRSLLLWQPVFSNITLNGADLVLVRETDGRITLAGFKQENELGNGAGDFATWLLNQGTVGLQESRITWRDKLGGRTLHVDNANILLRNQGQRHLLDVSVRLPSRLGKNLQVSLDMYGDPLQPMGRETHVYFQANDVNLAKLFPRQNIGGVDTSVDKASFAVWGGWRDGVLQQLSGNVNLHNIQFSRLKKTGEQSDVHVARTEISSAAGIETQKLQLDELSGRFQWQRQGTGWRFDGGQLKLSHDGKFWTPADVSLRYKSASGDKQTFMADVSYLRIEDVHQLLDMFRAGNKTVRSVLQEMQPHGEIQDAHLSWSHNESVTYHAYARVRNLAVNAWRGVPRVHSVDGQLWLDESDGVAVVNQAEGEIDFPGMFRWPLHINTLSGKVAWQLDEDGWWVSGRDLRVSDQAIHAQASLDIRSTGQGSSPYLSVVAQFFDGDASQVARYLPVGIMPKSSVKWLDSSIVGGRVVSGGTLIHGHLRDFPFDDNSGRFETRFHVDNGILNYAPGWPAIRGLSADVLFQGKGLAVKGTQGRIFNSHIQWVEAGISDMDVKPLPLQIRGEVQGSTQDKLDYLKASPQLNESIGKHLTDLHTTGDSLLNLDLYLPIGGDAKAEVGGWVKLMDNTLSMPPLGQVLTQVNGVMDFSQQGLSAKAISTKLLGQPSKISIATERANGRGTIQIKALGTVDAPSLAKRYLPTVADLVHGSSDLVVSLNIPLGSDGEQATRVRLKSGLKGITVELPPPLNKAVDEDFALSAEMDFIPQQAPLLKVNYGDTLSGILALTDNGVQRGELRFGGGTVRLPNADGIRLVGWLDHFSLAAWRGLWGEGVAGGASMGWLHSIDMSAHQAEVFGQVLSNPKLMAVRKAGDFIVQVESPEIAGEIRFPQGDGAIKADMQRVYLVAPEFGGGEADPRQFPDLSITVQDLRFEDRQFGQLKMKTSRTAEGMRVDQLVLKPKATHITAHGSWTIQDDKQHSQIELKLKTTDAGKTLKSIGYVGAISGGKGTASLSLDWPGSFADINAEEMEGKFHLHLTDGQLLEVNPGAGGRIFGMLSIQTLPRRLFLDFSDVFSKGFGFDVIEGDFQIDAGDAYTNNLYMDGPSARIDVAGRTGLAQQDYDQLVTVTPHLTESLPVLGALAATPQIGAAILFVQKLIQPEIHDVTRTQYTITGSWQNPKIHKVKKKKATPPVDVFAE